MEINFIEIASQIILEWADGVIQDLFLKLILSTIFVLKIYPWAAEKWDKILGRC